MTDEYIHREDAVDAVCAEWCGAHDAHCDACAEVHRINALPSADVAPVIHSRWIKTADGAECENCGREAVYQIVDDHWEYEPWCPHCGAIMDNKRGNENDQ